MAVTSEAHSKHEWGTYKMGVCCKFDTIVNV